MIGELEAHIVRVKEKSNCIWGLYRPGLSSRSRICRWMAVPRIISFLLVLGAAAIVSVVEITALLIRLLATYFSLSIISVVFVVAQAISWPVYKLGRFRGW